MSTAFENAWLRNDLLWQAMLGWTGVDQYDEANKVGQALLDEFERCVRAAPRVLRPGRELRRRRRAPPGPSPTPIRSRPTASGRARAGEDDPRRVRSTGTYLSFGNWMHRGWVGAGYLVARHSTPTASTRTSSPASAALHERTGSRCPPHHDPRVEHLVDGRLVEGSAGTFANVDPATEAVIGEVSDASADDVRRAVDAARRSFDETDWSTDHAFRAGASCSCRRPSRREGGAARGADPRGRLPPDGHARPAARRPAVDALRYPPG